MNARRDKEALTRTISIIERDVMNAMRLSTNAITITDHDALGGWADDTLAVMTSSPLAMGNAGGTVVYRVVEGGIVQSDTIPGLYRWIIPGKRPNEVNTARLEAENGQLVLPEVAEFSVEIPGDGDDDEEEARKNYTGALTKGLRVRVRRGKRTGMTEMLGHDKKEEREDELTRTIALP